MIRLELNEDERHTLTQVSRQAVGRVALRAQMVLLCGRGYTVPQIAQIHDCGEEVVRTWLHRYEDQGFLGCRASRAAVARPRTGWPPRSWIPRPARRPIALARCGRTGWWQR